MFRDVEIVIAPHGGACTNMVFAPIGATLIEFFGNNYINGCYWALTNICGQKHAFLTGPSYLGRLVMVQAVPPSEKTSPMAGLLDFIGRAKGVARQISSAVRSITNTCSLLHVARRISR